MLQVTHPLRQGVHFTQPFVHLLQTVGHLLETFAQARLQGGLQFFVHCLTHFIKLGGVALLKLRQLRFQSAAHFSEASGIGLG